MTRLVPEDENIETVSAIFEETPKEKYKQYLNDNGRLDDNYCQVIKKYHNSVVGHSGVERTIKKMEEYGVKRWKHMREHVKFYIRHICACCQKMSQLKPLIHANPFSTSAYRIMEVINVNYS